MRWVAPTERDEANHALEKRLAENTCLKRVDALVGVKPAFRWESGPCGLNGALASNAVFALARNK